MLGQDRENPRHEFFERRQIVVSRAGNRDEGCSRVLRGETLPFGERDDLVFCTVHDDERTVKVAQTAFRVERVGNNHLRK